MDDQDVTAGASEDAAEDLAVPDGQADEVTGGVSGPQMVMSEIENAEKLISGLNKQAQAVVTQGLSKSQKQMKGL